MATHSVQTAVNCRTNRLRGVAAVQVLVLLGVLLGFAALAIDVGNIYVVKGELQNGADAAALAGASAFADDYLRREAYGDEPEWAAESVTSVAVDRSVAWAARNKAASRLVSLGAGDVVVGHFDFDTPSLPIDLAGTLNAVQVTARFTGNNANGPVSNIFAPLLGFHTSDVTATATAAFSDRFAGYVPPNNGPLIPFTIHKDIYEDMLVNGPDVFSYDANLDTVQAFSDGISEVKLFPYEATDPPEGAGNFGVLNVGNPNQGVPALRDQIENGITMEDIEAEIGVPKLTFIDDNGNPITYGISGNSGMDNGVQSAVEARAGDIVGFFIHTGVFGTGEGATYTIVSIAFGRVMDVRLTGSPSSRQIIVQPEVYTDPGVITDENAPSSGGMVGQIILVR